MGYGIKLKKPSFTNDTRIYTLKNLPEVLIPISDNHTLTVREGERVLVGQLLGVSLTPDTPLLCSVSGTVGGTFTVDERDYLRVVNDHKYEQSSDIAPCQKRLSEMSREEMIERIRVCGIHEWKTLSRSTSAKRFVINCIDEDPYSNAKKCIIKNRQRELIGGAKIVMKLLSLRMCEFAIEKNASESINDLVDCIGESALFDIVETEGKYPLGERERIISQLPSADELDEDALFILDPDTVCAIYRAFAKGTPYIRRAVSIGGSAAQRCGTYLLPIGTPVKYLTDYTVNKEEQQPYSIFKNGVMRGSRLSTADGVITNSTHSLTYIKKTELTTRVDSCISCGRCDNVCPDKLLPSLFIEKHEESFDMAINLSGMDLCSECGACSYVCPASIPIVEIAKGDREALKPNNRLKKREISRAPFIRSKDSTTTINADFILTLIALLGWAMCVFGSKALVICGVCMLSALVSDFLFSLLTKGGARSSLDLNSITCGMLCAMTMTVRVPLYVCVIAPFFAIMIIRGAFGGCGKNIIHSVFAARIFVSLFWHDAFVYPERSYTMFDRLLGNTAGGFGEISVIILCACALYLVLRRTLSILPIISTISTFAVITFLTAEAGNAINVIPLSLFGTAIIFVSIYTSTELSTVPKTPTGKIAYGIVCGALSAVIVRYTDSEGAYIASVIASLATVPLFNHLRQIEPYGDEEEREVSQVDLESIFGKAESPAPSTFEHNYETTVSDTEASEESESISCSDNEADHGSTTMYTVQSNVAEQAQSKEVTPVKNEQNGQSTESFHIESAEELLDILAHEIGLAETSEENALTDPDEKKQDESSKEDIYSTALFNRLYEEMDLDDDPDDILNIKKK